MTSPQDITQRYLDITGAIILVIRPNEIIDYINKRGCDILGLPVEKIIGKNWFDHFIPEPEREKLRKTFNKVLAGGMDSDQVYENAVISAEGKQLFIAWNNALIRNDDGEVIGTLSSGQDVTKRVQAEQELRESEEKYRSFFEDDLTGDYISSADGQILFCNLAFLNMLGFKNLEEAQQTNTIKLYQNPEARAKLLSLLGKYRKLENYEMELQNLKGDVVYVSANIIGSFDEEERLTQIKGYLYDITGHKRTEEQFWLAQKMEAIGRLAGGVAHDFNNLLSVINGYSDLAMHRLPKDHPLHKDLSMVFQAGKKAEALTRQLLAFSRRQVMKPRVIDLNSLIHDLEKMLLRIIGEDIELITRVDPDLGAVKADPTQLEQVLMNLAVNSRDAMPQGGKLIIETRNVVFNSDMVQERVTMSAGNYVMLAVTDTGAGIDDQTQSNIFEPFFTTKEKGKGTGLGLSTVYGIIKQSGGYIWVYSEVSKGTTFKIYLPQVSEKVENLGIIKAPPETLRGTEMVLLVEDDSDVRAVSEQILNQFGYKVLQAANGNEALQIISKSKNKIDIIITDVVMPGMGGKELVDKLIKAGNGFKVLYLSGYSDEAALHHGIMHDDVDFLAKPFGTETLLRKVREVLDT
jgi:PAS domain S-box-containing protein